MGYILRLPSINAPTDTEKIEQLRTYLYQTVKDIEFSLNALESNASPVMVQQRDIDVNSIFPVIKQLIIRSTDILNAYYDVIKDRLDGFYVPIDGYYRHLRVDGDILEYTGDCQMGTTYIVTDGNTEGLPDNFVHCVGTIQKITNRAIIQITDIDTNIMASKSCVEGEWQDEWKLFLPYEEPEPDDEEDEPIDDEPTGGEI